jgi:hypothetical protein
MLFANVEYRYLSCALLICPILMGIGATYFCNVVRNSTEARQWRTQPYQVAAGTVILVYAGLVSFIAINSGPLFQSLDRNVLKAFLAAHREPQLCGLGAIGIGWAEGWSYTYLDRDVPLYGASFSTVKIISSTGATVPQSVVLRRKPLPTYSDDELKQHPQLYTVLVAPSDDGVPGFTRTACFGNDEASANNPAVCLFKRPGGCEQAN